jgi:adenylate kinase family enzyme
MQPHNGPIQVGRHVVVWGATGSGKTTFTSRLGRSLGLHVVQLDAIRHEHGWDSTDWPEFRERLVATLETHAEGWVTDGSYSRISGEYLSRADSLIWLHLPWRLSFWRLLKRTVWRAWTGEPLYNESGPRESWRLSFTSSRSILWWSISHHRIGVRTTRERIAQLPPGVPAYELRSPAEVRAFLEAVEVSSQAPTN